MSRSLRSRTRSTSSIQEVKSESPTREDTRTLRRKRKQDSEDDVSDVESGSALQDSENVSGRPFQIIGNLPASIDEPDYNSTLTHTLSVKDSGVLYSSLIQSRKTWFQGEMFEVYWIRPQRDPNNPDASGNTGIRDKMQKMCDCTMTAGPHEFSVRLFILKDDDKERLWQEEQDGVKKAKEDKKQEAIEEKKKRIEERKQQQLLRKQEKERRSVQIREAKLKAKLEQDLLREKMKEERRKRKEEEKLLKKQQQKPSKPAPTSQSKSNKNDSSGKEENTEEKMIVNLNFMAQHDPELNKLMGKVAGGQASIEEIEKFKGIIEIAKKQPPPPGWSPTAGWKLNNQQKATVPIVQLKNSGSPKIIASDKEQQTAHSGSEQKEDNTIKKDKTNASSDIESDHKKKETEAEKSPSKKELDKDDNDELKESENSAANEPEGKTENHVSSESRQSSIKTEDSELPFTKMEDNNDEIEKKPRKKRLSKKEKIALNIVEEQKLTAFQQKYVEGAQLVLEFLEFTNFRYRLPDDCVLEFDEDENIFIISWIVIHNIKDINRFSRKKKVKSLVEALFLDDCPSPLFSTMDIKLSEIPTRFNPIIINSVKPLEEVQKRMERIIEIGTRLSGYNLWYQLDGYDDSEMAENFRLELNEYEHALRGKRQKKNM